MLVGRPPFETTEVKKTYERIKRNSYSFPDYVPVSENGKHLIQNLLVQEPCNIHTFKKHMNIHFLTEIHFLTKI